MDATIIGYTCTQIIRAYNELNKIKMVICTYNYWTIFCVFLVTVVVFVARFLFTWLGFFPPFNGFFTTSWLFEEMIFLVKIKLK